MRLLIHGKYVVVFYKSAFQNMAFVLLTIFKKSKCLQCDTWIHTFKSTIENSTKQALPDFYLLVQLKLILKFKKKKKNGGHSHIANVHFPVLLKSHSAI